MLFLIVVGGRSAQAADLIRNLRHSTHFLHVVYPHDMRAVQDRCRHRRRRSENRLAIGRLRQKRFARRADQNRKSQFREPAQLRQNLGILLFSLAEADARIHHDAAFIHTGAPRAAGGRFQILPDGPDRVRHGRQFRPRLGQTPHVIQNQTGIRVGRGFRQSRIESEPARVVENLHAVLERAFGDLRFVRIERQRDGQLVFEQFQYGQQAAPLLVRRNTCAFRARRFRTDIDNVCALLLHFHGAGVGAVGIAEMTAV